MSGGDKVRNLGGFLSRLGAHRQAEGERPETGPGRESEEGPPVATKALRKFLTYLGTRPAPVLLDLGPVVGSNVTFFGEQLNCKVYIEDIFADLDRHLSQDKLDQFPGFLSKRFTLGEGTVDGVLLWDLYDFLDRRSAQSLASALVRLLRPDGALLGFFGSAGQGTKGFTRFVIADEGHPGTGRIPRWRSGSARRRTATSSRCSRGCVCRIPFCCRTTCARSSSARAAAAGR